MTTVSSQGVGAQDVVYGGHPTLKHRMVSCTVRRLLDSGLSTATARSTNKMTERNRCSNANGRQLLSLTIAHIAAAGRRASRYLQYTEHDHQYCFV
ncbi:unnamed protein product [Tilletia controversa]|nr:hypothetical protein CF335_g9554 [Tilletia laevis]CAD6895825.1 unnamed protein product [Tilletia controversa]CAD6933308.1 unnamed protein product [Tilletia caries]CAD6920851.1 unnamed protein product [Tilletia controversa]CAD6942899.1 unnamed protein product [Tilletia caries]